MLMQNFGTTNKEHYGMLQYFLEWSVLSTTLSLSLCNRRGRFAGQAWGLITGGKFCFLYLILFFHLIILFFQFCVILRPTQRSWPTSGILERTSLQSEGFIINNWQKENSWVNGLIVPSRPAMPILTHSGTKQNRELTSFCLLQSQLYNSKLNCVTRVTLKATMHCWHELRISVQYLTHSL